MSAGTLELEIPLELDSESTEQQIETNAEAITETEQQSMTEASDVPVAKPIDDQQPVEAVAIQTSGREMISDGVTAWEEQTQALEHEISDLTIERAELSERSKSLKKRLDSLTEELSDLRQDGPQPIYKTQPVTGTDGDSSSAPSAPNQSIAWRSVPLSVLFEPRIKGFGKKKTEAMLDLCPTLGYFEDLRAKVGIETDAFHKLLPDMIGPDLASELEERALNWLTNNRDSYQPSNQTESPSIPTSEEWENMTDAQRSVFLTERASSLQTSNSLAKVLTDLDYWESGFEACGRSAEITDCPYFPGDWQDDWVRGFLSRDAVESADSNAEPIEQAAIPAEANQEEAQPEMSLADL